MSKKIAIGIINTHEQDTYNQLVKSLPPVDYIFNVHHTSKYINTSSENLYNRYMSYGGLYNYILRKCLSTDADYIFLIKSNLYIEDASIFEDYINTASIFGTWFMSGGSRGDKFLSIEDELTKKSLNLFENLNHSFIFMLKSHIKNCGFFHEGYINIDSREDINCLEMYDFYSKIESKFEYLPKGYFPDVDTFYLKTRENNTPSFRPGLKHNTTNNITSAYGRFFHEHKFVPGKHKTYKKEDAMAILEKIQKTYGN